MKDVKVSLSVPAHIYSFGETKGFTQNKYVTHAKLKVFYVGQTGDNRVFTKQFSDQLLLTLPGTPVVAYFDPDKDDFIGHNYEQSVFGYVPDAAAVEYLQEGDKLFAVTDVLLFTGREDSIGEIAKKIIGKQHSLELDPATVKYTIVRAGGKIDSITFNEGHFIGLSVLGDDEQPAFGGSEFFSESSTLSIRELGKVYRNFFNLDEKTDIQDQSTTYETENAETENTQMSEQQTEVKLVDEINLQENFTESEETNSLENAEVVNATEKTEEEETETEVVNHTEVTTEEENKEEFNQETPEEAFIANPYEDRKKRLSETLRNFYPNDSIEIEQMDEQSVVYYCYSYALEKSLFYKIGYAADGAELVGDPVEVHKRYLTTEEIARAFGDPGNMESSESEVQILEGTENARENQKTEEESVAIANTAALDNAEREELNAYRKTAKYALIDSYNDLDVAVRESFKEQHEKFTLEQLDKELAFELVKVLRNQPKNTNYRVFSMNLPVGSNKPDTVEDLIEKYKDKH